MYITIHLILLMSEIDFHMICCGFCKKKKKKQVQDKFLALFVTLSLQIGTLEHDPLKLLHT